MDTTTPSWAGRAVQAPTVPPTPEEPRSNTVAVIVAGALIAIGIGTAGFFIGRGLGNDAAPVAAQSDTTTIDGAAETSTATETVAPSTTVTEPAPTTAAETTAPTTSETTAPSTTIAADEETPDAPAGTTPTTRAAETVPATEATETAPVRAAVLSGGVLYLRGAVPSQEIADLIADRAAAVIGADNVVVEYTIDPNSSVPESAPLYVEDVVLFAYGSDEVNPAFAPLLDLGTLLMTQNPQVTVTIVSHTDTDGSAEFNLDLSRRRGGAIARYWIERGIEPDRIAIDARGESEPRADESSPEGAQANRRAEFVITGLLG